MSCKVCGKEFSQNDFYSSSKSKCKECTKAAVRNNRIEKIDYYRDFDRRRSMLPHRVAARNEYAKTESGIESRAKARIKWASRNSKKRMANILVGNAVRDGNLKKKFYCESCGINGERIHGHHCDYDKPLDVMWLCSKCHKEWHKINGEGLNAK